MLKKMINEKRINGKLKDKPKKINSQIINYLLN